MTHFSDGVRVGNAFPVNVEPGMPISAIYVYDVVPVALAATGICAAQSVAGAANLLINGTLAASGAVALDVPRAVSIVSSNAGDTAQVATVTGFSAYGSPMSEAITFNGTTTVSGKKAFGRVTGVRVSAAMTGNASVGTTDILGLPYAVPSRGYVQTAWADAFVTTGTFVGADATTATTTTGDTRGTFLPPSATNGTRRLVAWIAPPNVASTVGIYGVSQA